jgi:hypothetical protein
MSLLLSAFVEEQNRQRQGKLFGKIVDFYGEVCSVYGEHDFFDRFLEYMQHVPVENVAEKKQHHSVILHDAGECKVNLELIFMSEDMHKKYVGFIEKEIEHFHAIKYFYHVLSAPEQ